MHNTESVQENGMHKVLWNSEKQTDHLISARRPDLVIKLKEKFAVPVDHRVKSKRAKRRMNISILLGKFKKNIEHESDGDTNCNWCTWNNPQRIVKGDWKTVK